MMRASAIILAVLVRLPLLEVCTLGPDFLFVDRHLHVQVTHRQGIVLHEIFANCLVQGIVLFNCQFQIFHLSALHLFYFNYDTKI